MAYPFLILVFLSSVILVSSQRREINSLSDSELQALRVAMQRLFDNGEWVRIAGDHGTPNNFCPHVSWMSVDLVHFHDTVYRVF